MTHKKMGSCVSNPEATTQTEPYFEKYPPTPQKPVVVRIAHIHPRPTKT